MRSTPVALTLTVLVFWSPPVVMAQAAGAKTAPASARPPETQAERPPLRVTFDDRPSLEIGSVARVDLRVTFQGDLRHADVPEAVVYRVVKALHDHKKELVAVFAGLRRFDTEEMAIKYEGLEYHTGAIKFYKEIGQWPPKER